jgi:hypothetical protein
VVTGSAERNRQPEPGQAGQGELAAQAVFQRELAGDEALASVADHRLNRRGAKYQRHLLTHPCDLPKMLIQDD